MQDEHKLLGVLFQEPREGSRQAARERLPAGQCDRGPHLLGYVICSVSEQRAQALHKADHAWRRSMCSFPKQ